MEPGEQPAFCSLGEGYRGIWWGQSPTRDEYGYKYSGGLGTYPVQHRPFAIYSPEARRTYFVWGGHGGARSAPTSEVGAAQLNRPGQLLHMVSYFDHDTKTVPRPTVLFDKWTADPHDNPVLALDGAGHVWIFSPSHGRDTTASYIHRSVRPHDIRTFETVEKSLFAYPQPWWMDNQFAFFHTRYGTANGLGEGRGLYFQCGRPGAWHEPQLIAHLVRGNYQVSAVRSNKVGTAFDYHPEQGGLDARTNLYYLESMDCGQTWRTAGGDEVALPVTTIRHRALVRDYEAEGLLCYIKDLAFDPRGHPCILYVTSRGWRPGPGDGPHQFNVARWDGGAWRFHAVGRCDNNYDSGCLDFSHPGAWRIWATTAPGPQPFSPGGELELWESRDLGQSWKLTRSITAKSRRNHSHPRGVLNGQPGFVALWADGNPLAPSPSCLFFANDAGEVYELPETMDGDRAYPRRITHG